MTLEQFRAHWRNGFDDLSWPFARYALHLRDTKPPIRSFWAALERVVRSIEEDEARAHQFRFHSFRTAKVVNASFRRARDRKTASTVLEALGCIQRDAAGIASDDALEEHMRWWKGSKDLRVASPSSWSTKQRRAWTDGVEALVRQVRADGVDELWVRNAIRTLRAIQLDGSSQQQLLVTAALKQVGAALWAKGKGRQRTESPQDRRATHNEAAARSAAVKRLVAGHEARAREGMSKNAAAQEAARRLRVRGDDRRQFVLRAFAKKIGVDWRTVREFVPTPRRA